MENDPVKRIARPGYTILIFQGAEELDLDDDNVDVEVRLDDGRRWGATFFTLRNIKTLLSRYEFTGDCRRGLYLTVPYMVIVRELTHESIIASVEDLKAENQLEQVFERLDANA
jgi:hypothetical protein